MNEKIVSNEEMDMLLKQEIENINTEINRWAKTVDVNVALINDKNKPKTHFFAKMACTVCGHEHYVNNMNRVQFQNCEMAISAKFINAVLGFDYDSEKAAELNEKLKKAETEELRSQITKQIADLDDFFRIRFLCGTCAKWFQVEFKKVFDLKIMEIGKRNFI
jgi:hypothetical protein